MKHVLKFDSYLNEGYKFTEKKIPVTAGQDADIRKKFPNYDRDKAQIIAEGGNDNGKTFLGSFIVRIGKRRYKFEDGEFVKEVGLTEAAEADVKSKAPVEIRGMSSLQIVKLTDLLDSDITAYGADDMEYYSEMTGLDAGTLADLYVGYGYNKTRKWAKVEAIKKEYTKAVGKEWSEIKKEAEDAE